MKRNLQVGLFGEGNGNQLQYSCLENLVDGVFTVMLFPAVPVLTAQDHQFPLFSSQGSKMRDLHDHRPDTARQNIQCGQELTTSKTSTSTLSVAK